jgi:pentatricopeptide repeat protein
MSTKRVTEAFELLEEMMKKQIPRGVITYATLMKEVVYKAFYLEKKEQAKWALGL